MPRAAPILVPMLFMLSMTALGACGTTGVYGDWDAPTEFRFASLTEKEAQDFADVFEANNVEYTREDTRDEVVYRAEGIGSTWHLARIMHSIDKKAKKLRIESELDVVTISYAGLNTSASSSLTVTINVPRGASACIADGPKRTPWRPVPVSGNGTWKGEVKQDGVVATLDGWVYVAATRDGEFFRYSRVNIITGQEQRISFKELREAGLKEPKDCSR